MSVLAGKTVVLGVSGGIAAYKIATLASLLKKQRCDVHVIMTENATQFIPPLTFETLTGNRCIVDTFDRHFPKEVKHISLAQAADLFVVAPASANVIAKMAYGLADDMLTTTLLASRCQKIVAPAMNTAMFENPIVQNNIQTLVDYGFEIVSPISGYLACGDTGTGKMVEPAVLYDYIEKHLACEKDLAGKKVVVTAGPTQESLDPVRFMTNHSTGKMGYAIARAAMLRGADVTLITGPTQIPVPLFVNVISVTSASEMFEAVKSQMTEADILIKTAAVADYTFETTHDEKLKKKDEALTLSLAKTQDILHYVGHHKKPHQFICGFSMETQHLVENSRAKLERKQADMIAANNLKVEGAGFKSDTNVLTLITKHQVTPLPLMNKSEAAHALLDAIITEMTGR